MLWKNIRNYQEHRYTFSGLWTSAFPRIQSPPKHTWWPSEMERPEKSDNETPPSSVHRIAPGNLSNWAGSIHPTSWRMVAHMPALEQNATSFQACDKSRCLDSFGNIRIMQFRAFSNMNCLLNKAPTVLFCDWWLLVIRTVIHLPLLFLNSNPSLLSYLVNMSKTSFPMRNPKDPGCLIACTQPNHVEKR